MSFWAYMLHCRGGKFYTGHTDNVELRLAQHQSGLIAGFTAGLLPEISRLAKGKDGPSTSLRTSGVGEAL